jgi:Ca-activated chloride channel family protein
VSPVRSAVRPDEETVTHVVVRVHAPTPPLASARPRLTAVMALDVSGSMRGEPLAHVLQSARRVAEILDDTDQLGVVAFSSGAKTVAPLRPLAEGRRELLSALAAVEAERGTNIAKGLTEASLLFPRRDAGERQILLLLSDGEPTLGVVSSADLGALGRIIKARDVAVSTLGYGAKHDDRVLGAIAEGGGGRYGFVVDPKLAEASFIRALGAQLDVVAEHVELLLAPGDGVEIVRVLEDPRTAVCRGGLRVPLADMVAGDERNVVVELRIRAPRAVGSLRALTVTLSGCPASGSTPFELVRPIELFSTETGGPASDRAARAVVSVALAAEARVRARALADRGSFAGAEAQLRDAQALVAATPGFVADDGSALADAYQTLADEIRVMARRPSRDVYEVFRHSVHDHADLAMSGPAPRSGGKLSEAPRESRALLDRARAGQPAPRAFVRVVTGPRAGLRLALIKERFVIGRAKGSTDLTLPDADVSRHHSVIELAGGAFWLVDMGSTNGPIVKGKRVARHQLSHGDEFLIGDSLIRYEVEPSTVLN